MNMNTTKMNLTIISDKSQANIAPRPYVDVDLIESLEPVSRELMSIPYEIFNNISVF